MTETTPVACPACFEVFEVPAPPPSETSENVDYDCEVCCRPMVITYYPGQDEFDEVTAEARSLDDL